MAKQISDDLKPLAAEWAAEHGRTFEAGFLACTNGEDYTNFQAEPWKMGYRSAVFIYYSLAEQREFTATHKPYVINPAH